MGDNNVPKIDFTKVVLPDKPYVAPRDAMNIAKPIINFKIPIKNENDIKSTEKDEAKLEFEKIKDMVKHIVPDVSDDFVNQLIDTSKKAKCNPDDLTALIFKESRFNPQEANGSFKGLGGMSKTSLLQSKKHAVTHEEESEGINPRITFSEFSKLSREEQMPYVKNYILFMKDSNAILAKKEKLTGGDLYALFITPTNAHKRVITQKGKLAYDGGNYKLDYDNDGKLSKNDLQAVLDSIKINVLSKENKNVKKG